MSKGKWLDLTWCWEHSGMCLLMTKIFPGIGDSKWLVYWSLDFQRIHFITFKASFCLYFLNKSSLAGNICGFTLLFLDNIRGINSDDTSDDTLDDTSDESLQILLLLYNKICTHTDAEVDVYIHDIYVNTFNVAWFKLFPLALLL